MNQKAAPRTSANYDAEMSAMKQIRNLLRRLSPEGRKRVMVYLSSVAFEDGVPAAGALTKPVDPRQTDPADIGL